ncbi:hypothetical protein [Helicobacter cetorum]|uniref:hypothetical protein n=1 Tax=Helicobacter cetorum TaxID=138563 RepID=UPI000CF0DAFB|nr:hypothetical protein [Helicobacter cetorum]
MITKENFKEVLETLDFKENNKIFAKTINNATLQVDFEKQELIYPKEIKVCERHTTNFRANENFVVFECVHRLLNQGYDAKHIVFRKKS